MFGVSIGSNFLIRISMKETKPRENLLIVTENPGAYRQIAAEAFSEYRLNLRGESQWERAIETIRSGIADAVVTDAVFLCGGNPDDPYRPASEIIRAIKEQGIPHVLATVASIPPDVHYFDDVPTVVLSCRDFRETALEVLGMLGVQKS